MLKDRPCVIQALLGSELPGLSSCTRLAAEPDTLCDSSIAETRNGIIPDHTGAFDAALRLHTIVANGTSIDRTLMDCTRRPCIESKQVKWLLKTC